MGACVQRRAPSLGGAELLMQAPSSVWAWHLEPGLSSAPHDLAGLEARGAHIDLAHGAGGNLRADRLDVRIPAPMRPAVRMRDAHAETGTLATHVTYGSHAEHHLSKICDRPAGPIRAVVIDPARAGQPPQGTDPRTCGQIRCAGRVPNTGRPGRTICGGGPAALDPAAEISRNARPLMPNRSPAGCTMVP